MQSLHWLHSTPIRRAKHFYCYADLRRVITSCGIRQPLAPTLVVAFAAKPVSLQRLLAKPRCTTTVSVAETRMSPPWFYVFTFTVTVTLWLSPFEAPVMVT
jgi:hypothetical protein